MNIPQDVRDRFNELLGCIYGIHVSEKRSTQLILAAQLLIAPATEKEIAQAYMDYHQPRNERGMGRVLNEFIFRRYHPLKYDPRRQDIADKLFALTENKVATSKIWDMTDAILAALDAQGGDAGDG